MNFGQRVLQVQYITNACVRLTFTRVSSPSFRCIKYNNVIRPYVDVCYYVEGKLLSIDFLSSRVTIAWCTLCNKVLATVFGLTTFCALAHPRGNVAAGLDENP
jgi:hypothetical protein